MENQEISVSGTLVWYYCICPREVWLIGHQINPDEDDANVSLGRFIQDYSYPRERKELIVGQSKMDIFRVSDQGLVIGEVKKSSRYRASARMQLAFYLSELKRCGIEARGELRFPREKSKEELVLDETHLDPRIGYLHATNFRRFTLNLDIAEIFKPILVDRLIFTLLGKKMITKDDFDRETKGIMMKDKARKCFVENLDEKLKTTINHRDIGRPVSYRRLIRLELYKLEKHLMGEKEYQAFMARW